MANYYRGGQGKCEPCEGNIIVGFLQLFIVAGIGFTLATLALKLRKYVMLSSAFKAKDNKELVNALRPLIEPRVRKQGLAPAVVGAADVQMLEACAKESIAAAGIAPGLDVWTYELSRNASTVVQTGKSEWKYYRHHKSSFLELGLVKAAFLWELLGTAAGGRDAVLPRLTPPPGI